MVTTEVPFTKESGVCKVKFDINGLLLHFVFDTGPSDVTISMVEATYNFFYGRYFSWQLPLFGGNLKLHLDWECSITREE